MALVVKSQPVNSWDIRDAGSILESGRSPGGGLGNSLQYSCLENPMDRGAWWRSLQSIGRQRVRQDWNNLAHICRKDREAWPATVHEVSKNCTQLNDWMTINALLLPDWRAWCCFYRNRTHLHRCLACIMVVASYTSVKISVCMMTVLLQYFSYLICKKPPPGNNGKLPCQITAVTEHPNDLLCFEEARVRAFLTWFHNFLKICLSLGSMKSQTIQLIVPAWPLTFCVI